MIVGLFMFSSSVSKTEAQAQLNLARVAGSRGPAESRERRLSSAEDVVGELQVRAVQDVEPFGDCFEAETLRQLKLAAQSQVERGEREAAARVAPDARRPVVEVRVEVAVVARQD